MKRQQCSNCIFSSWFHNFKSCSFKSKIIPLPVEFIEYLNTDGIVLPDSADMAYSNDLERYSDSDDEEGGWNNDDQDGVNSQTPSFPLLKQQVDKAIADLGLAVFPKLNWSCPKDAAWISHNGTVKCTSFNDICLLLKSSDFVTHDLMNAYEYCEDTVPHPVGQFELVLREWHEIVPGMEFRCFVKDNKLVGISQRHHSGYFQYLVANKQTYLNEILDFYNAKIKGKFADSNFVFDIYKKSDKYLLMDFNPFGPITDALLFTWVELEEINIASVDDNDDTFFRIITSSEGIQPSPFMTYAMPKDMVDLSRGSDINKMIDFFNVKNLISKPGDKEGEEE